jgi:hypothetical protein
MYRIENFEKNDLGRDFVIGDIHGMLDAVYSFLESVNFDFDKDRLFSVGDLIDRGPKSYEVLKLNNEKWFFSILGNHEVMLLTNYLVYAKDWYSKLDSAQKIECVEIIKSLPLAIEIQSDVGNIGLVHAQFPSSINDWDEYKKYIEESSLSYEMNSKKDKKGIIRESLWGRRRIYNELKKDGLSTARKAYVKFLKDGLWNRTILYKMITHKKTLPYLKTGLQVSFRTIKDKIFRRIRNHSYINNIKYTVHGHTPIKIPLLLGNQFFIDTGAVYGSKKIGTGKLTMIEINQSMTFHSFKI